ncbi:hypothetical protein HELRODRAFT_163596 [Helobdella robusta]|uniref:Protein tweety homolog n=1 Tax=Helobdella robusta TaxID=6412 RepID=T1EU97_HELRO|nr:hypothetical protein HELRODRAFT_163596 [Helobdella robusta]ESN96526.1 hypothetical protein HELRODRAFT_163596 [Helobdella robusta]
MAKPIVAPPMSTVIDSSGASKDYSPSQLALKLHTLPHLDLTFQRVNSSFNPDLYRYREAILFWSIVPLVWMFLTMLVVVMYFCYHCCQSDVQKAGVCLKWSIAVLALLSCGAVGAGFYGNEETHKGLQHFIDAAKGIQFTTSQTRAQIKWMEVNLNHSVISLANDLRSNIPRSHSLRTEINQHLDRSVRHVTSIISSVLDIGFKVKRIDSTIELVHYAGRYGFYRWLAMVLLFSWMMVLFVILLFAVGKGSKYLMLAFGILSIVSLILCWLAAGLHLGVIIGTADFCIAPLAYLEQMTEEKSDREIIKYYMKCDHQFVDNPFKNVGYETFPRFAYILSKIFIYTFIRHLLASQTIPSTYDNAREANISLAKVHMSLLKILPNSKEKEVVRDKMKKIFKGMDSTFQLLMHINALVECTNLHKDYLDGVSGICFNGLQFDNKINNRLNVNYGIFRDGMVFLLVSIGLTGIFFTGVVLLTSGSWRSFTSGFGEKFKKSFNDQK